MTARRTAPGLLSALAVLTGLPAVRGLAPGMPGGHTGTPVRSAAGPTPPDPAKPQLHRI